jgi:hypothetical protein
VVALWPVCECPLVDTLFVTETKKMNEYVQERRNLAGYHVATYGAVVDPVSFMEFGSVVIFPGFPELSFNSC